MNAEIAVRTEPTSDLAITNEQTFWTEKQKAALYQLGIANAHDADLAVFFHHCTRTGLDPFARQIYMIERKGKQTIQTGIDGFRLIARRATDNRRGTFGYKPTLWCGKDGEWVDVWLKDEPPAAAKVTVLRDGMEFPAVALYSEYVGTKRDGSITEMWRTKGALMLAKCAESLALRKAFPQDLSGLYTADEMEQAEPAVQMIAPSEPDGVVDTEVIEGQEELPVEDDPPDDEPKKPAKATAKQVQRIGMLATDLGLDREQKLAGVGSVIGREVETTKDLSPSEASTVIDSLQATLDARKAAAK